MTVMLPGFSPVSRTGTLAHRPALIRPTRLLPRVERVGLKEIAPATHPANSVIPHVGTGMATLKLICLARFFSILEGWKEMNRGTSETIMHGMPDPGTSSPTSRARKSYLGRWCEAWCMQAWSCAGTARSREVDASQCSWANVIFGVLGFSYISTQNSLWCLYHESAPTRNILQPRQRKLSALLLQKACGLR